MLGSMIKCHVRITPESTCEIIGFARLHQKKTGSDRVNVGFWDCTNENEHQQKGSARKLKCGLNLLL